MLKRGLFIVVEGHDGAGKSTLAKILVKHFEAVTFREPGSTKLGESLRSLLLTTEIPVDAQVMLFQASRIANIKENIEPALYAGKHVISDRYYLSTAAYQGLALGADMTLIDELNKRILQPDFTILLECSEEEVARRRPEGAADLYEAISVQRSVRDYYRSRKGPNMRMFNADRPVEDVADDVIDYIEQALETMRYHF